jgi:hypothetical protein
MRKLCRNFSLLLCLVVSLTGCGDKTGFSITEFKVIKNDKLLLEDQFNGTAPQIIDPTSAQAVGYQWSGQHAAPQNKKQLLSYEQAIVNPMNPVSMMNNAILETNMDTANQAAGLKPGMTFEVSGTFDMTVAEKIGQGFYIGLNDSQPASGAQPGVPAKDFIMLGYTQIKRATPINIVYFSSIDHTAAGSITNRTFAMISPRDGDQIKLRIKKADAATNRVTASYAFVKQGVVGPYIDLEQTMLGADYMPIFRERAYTRPMFGAFWAREKDSSDPSGKSAAIPPTPPVVQLTSLNPGAKEELIEVATRATSAKALLSYVPGKKPLFVALMMPGGDGSFRFESTPAGVTMANAARLQNRLRPLLLQRGIASVLLDAPDDNPEMRLSFRETPQHLDDLKAALAETGKRFPGVPVVAVGHSMGAWSATFLSAAMPEKIAATVLIDSVLVDGDVLNRYDLSKGVGHGISGYDWNKVRVPLLMIHHKKDDCLVAPYGVAKNLAQRTKRIELLSIDSDKDVSTGFCGLSGPHNEDGHEVLIADSIKKWAMQHRTNAAQN